MTPKAKLFLTLAAGSGLFLLLGSKKDAKADTGAGADEDVEALPPVAPPVEIPGVPQPPVVVRPLPGEVLPPPRPIPDDDDERDEPIVRVPVPLPPEENFPPIIPKPAPSPQPQPQPPPQLKVPPPFEIPVPRPPVIVEDDEGELPQAPPEEAPTELAQDTADVLRVMLSRESTADWKRKEPLLGVWQKKRGLKVDQKFGPGTALVMAEETGLLPIVRFWPKGSLKETGAVDDYAQALLEEAAEAEEPRRSQLMAAAEREQGQGFGRNPVPITPTISL